MTFKIHRCDFPLRARRTSSSRTVWQETNREKIPRWAMSSRARPPCSRSRPQPPWVTGGSRTRRRRTKLQPNCCWTTWTTFSISTNPVRFGSGSSGLLFHHPPTMRGGRS
ncbi:unnamed protein product [Amoebophrya sp. A120]|nr:unnamed protein product [Amoebophrya sp. A120]|eukprot:GSA120T00008618001.1